MFSKLLIISSIILNTFGFGNSAANIDRGIIDKEAGSTISAVAAVDFQLPEIKIPPHVQEFSSKENIGSQNYVLVDPDSGAVFAQKAYKNHVPIASTTKIMTASIVLENYNLDDVVTVSAYAASQIGATANFRVGEQITVLNLLKCLLIKSANEAAYALAENMNGAGETGVAKFVTKMNEKAKELGMENTEYHDPAGLDVTGWSSAYDLSIITKYALKKETFSEIVKTVDATATDVTGKLHHDLHNSNRLVAEWNYPGAIGVKTGYMPEAGHCLVGAAKRNGHTLIAVILHTNSDAASASAEEARKLLDWGFANVVWND